MQFHHCQTQLLAFKLIVFFFILVIVLAKNHVFHDRSKHIDTRFHYIQDCIINKEIEVKYVKT